MRKLLNRTSLGFVLTFTVIVLAVLAITFAATGYLHEQEVAATPECPPGETC